MKNSITAPIRKRRGSTLIELIFVAFMIGSVGIAMYMTLLYGEKVNQRNSHYSRAAEIVAQEMEIIRSTPYASLTVPYNSTFIGSTDPVTDLPGGASNLTVTTYATGVKQAVATVSWLENSKSTSVSYTTLVVDQGLNQ